MTDTRPCTCAPDERPYPCQHQYALGLCRKVEIRSLRAELDRCIAQIGDLAKLRSEEEITHGNVMGRIAVALFGDQNNRTDEECVAVAAEIGYQLAGTQQALFQAQEAAKMLRSEVDALRDGDEFKETALKGYRNNIDDLKADLVAAKRERDEWKAAAQAAYGHDLEAALAELGAEKQALEEWLLFNKEYNEANESRRRLREEINTLTGDLVATRHERDVGRADLAAARALLNEAQGFIPPDTAWDYTTDAGGYLYDRIDAALAGDKP